VPAAPDGAAAGSRDRRKRAPAPHFRARRQV